MIFKIVRSFLPFKWSRAPWEIPIINISTKQNNFDIFKLLNLKTITENILQLFGIKDMDDNHSFTRMNLIDLKTVEKMTELFQRRKRKK